MKIRKHRKKEWWFYPHEDSAFKEKKPFIFKYKRDLMKLLKGKIDDAVNGTVVLHEQSFGHSGSIREWVVWYNENAYRFGADLKVDLKQLDFRGKKYITSKNSRKISRNSKRYFAFSNKVIYLMCAISDKGLDKTNASKLTFLFKKRGFKDFEPDQEEKEYIEYYLSEGIDFYHWSDRCNWLRTKTVLEFLKKEKLIEGY